MLISTSNRSIWRQILRWFAGWRYKPRHALQQDQGEYDDWNREDTAEHFRIPAELWDQWKEMYEREVDPR